MYERVCTRIKSLCSEIWDFSVRVGVQQGLAPSPYSFSLITDEITRDVQEDVQWCTLFVDDIVLVEECPEEMNGRLKEWREAFESKGLRISRHKTEYI